jgi:hypothetical protein
VLERCARSAFSLLFYLSNEHTIFARCPRANLVLGAWLVISPWMLDFSGVVAAIWNAVIVAAVVAVLALWALGTGKDIGGWWSPVT